MVAPLLAGAAKFAGTALLSKGAASAMGKGGLMGGGAMAVQKLFGGGKDEPKAQQAPQNQPAPGEPAPQAQQAVYPQMAGTTPVMMSAAPVMIPAGATVPMAGPSVGEVPGTAARQAPAEQNFAGTHDSHAKSMGKTLLAAAAGGIGGAMMKQQEGASSPAELLKGAMAGAGAGGLAKMSYESIQRDGSGLTAGMQSGAAAALASTLKPGGPGMGTAAMMGFGGGALGNAVHDRLEASGDHKSADAISGAGLGGALGYALTGDGKESALIAAGSGAASTGLGALDRRGGVSSLLGENKPSEALAAAVGAADKDQQAGPSGPQLG